jgi:hypothetical protein
MEILKDGSGKPQGIIRQIAGGQERLTDIAGNAIATYRPSVNFTYDNGGRRIGSGNRLAGMVDDDKE